MNYKNGFVASKVKSVASTLEMPILIEPGKTTEIEAETHYVLPQIILMPRSERHPSQKKKSIWSLLLRAVTRLLIRRRKGHFISHTQKTPP